MNMNSQKIKLLMSSHRYNHYLCFIFSSEGRSRRKDDVNDPFLDLSGRVRHSIDLFPEDQIAKCSITGEEMERKEGSRCE